MCLESGFRIAPNWPYIRKITMTSEFVDMTSFSKVFYVVLFLLSSLVTSVNLMSISSLVLELWQSSFIRDWPEIRKSEIPPCEFCPISGDWGKSGIPNLTQISLIKCYWMLQNARITAFTVSEKNQVFSQNVTHPVTGFNSWDVQHFKWLITLKLSDGPQIKHCYRMHTKAKQYSRLSLSRTLDKSDFYQVGLICDSLWIFFISLG